MKVVSRWSWWRKCHSSWRRGVVVNGVRHWTKLTHVGPGYNWDWWPSSSGYTISGCNQPTRSTQPCMPPGSLNRVPASAGVTAGMSPLPGAIPYGMWVPVAVRRVANCYTPFTLLYFTLLQRTGWGRIGEMSAWLTEGSRELIPDLGRNDLLSSRDHYISETGMKILLTCTVFVK